MNPRKFFIWLLKNLIIILLGTLIFSTVSLNLPDLVTGIFGDVYGYSSPEAQKEVVNNLADACSSLDKGENVVTMNQICTNETLMTSMRENCIQYHEAKAQGLQIENEENVAQTCEQIESGELEKSCRQIKSKQGTGFSGIGALCKDYRAGRVDDKELFSGFIGLYTGQSNMPEIGLLKKYNSAINYLNKNKFLYFVIFFALLFLLYIAIKDMQLFLVSLAQISLGLGILIMLPYFGILAYQHFVGFDTTSILSSMFSLGGIIDPKAIFSVILLLFLRTYNDFIITLGIVFLIVGIAGKVYEYRSRKNKKPEVKMKKKKARNQKDL